MEPIFGFMLFFAACLIVSIIASKRGRSGLLFFLLCSAAGFGLVVLVSNAGGTGLAAGFTAFLSPLAGFVIALSAKSSAQLAVEHGVHGDFKKCPYCAEPVRLEAIKCKHCGSALVSVEDSQPVNTQQSETDLPELEQMQKYGITKDRGQYVFQTYRYDRLSDAVAPAGHRACAGWRTWRWRSPRSHPRCATGLRAV